MHSAKILPLPATPPIAAIRLRSLAEPVPPRYRYSPYRTWFLATPVAPHPSPSASQSAAVSAPPVLALQPRSLLQLPRYRRLVSRSFRAPCRLFGPTVVAASAL